MILQGIAELIVGDEDHEAIRTVDFNPGLDASDDPNAVDLDHLITDDFPLILDQVA